MTLPASTTPEPTTLAVQAATPPASNGELAPKLAGWALRLLACLFLVLLLSGIALALSSANAQWRAHPFAHSLAVWHNARARNVQDLLPVSRALASGIVFLGLLFGAQISQRAANRCFVEARYRRFKREYDDLKMRHNLLDSAAVLSPALSLLEQVRSGKVADRDALLRVFAATKRKLDEIGRDLAFLSLDVVGSTELKRGEEKAAVEHDFKAFMAWIETILRQRGALKIAWTPDGAMAAFPNLDDAVSGAQAVLDGLDSFNANTKVVRRPFAIRCGINSGYVYFEPDAPLETLSDRVLDIAAHLQRAALPNSLCVARPAIEPLRTQQGFAPTGRVVDGYEVFEWKCDAPKPNA